MLTNFLNWEGNREFCMISVHSVYPLTKMLYYSSHKRRTHENVNAMRAAEANLDRFWQSIDSYYEKKTETDRHSLIEQCLQDDGAKNRTKEWAEPTVVQAAPAKHSEHEYRPLSGMTHDKSIQITGAFDRMSIEKKAKVKTRAPVDRPREANENLALELLEPQATEEPDCTFSLDKPTHKVFKTLFHVPLSEAADLPKVVKWDEFKRAMARVGFAVEKLQGATWQFTPSSNMNVKVGRGIHFNEPHPDNDIPFKLARYFGRKLERADAWNGDMFKVA